LYHTVTRVQNIVTAYNYFDQSSDVDITQTTNFTTFSGSIATSFATIDGGTY
jgi:hypothetical protein